jgi:hypothetical protein
MYEREEMVKCTSCRGRGYHRCACWPGDCICGEDDRDCEECDGSGWTWPDEDIDTLIERACLEGEASRIIESGEQSGE